MRFQFTVEGQPPSVNHMYARTRTGGVRKADGVESYQTGITHIVRTTRPVHFVLPENVYIHIHYAFYLKRDIDCDNLLKALNDAIAIGLGVNDKWFLPCVEFKAIKQKEPHVFVTVEYP
jgi:Holliday junction resolvase RusA-like endonuclease